MIENSFHGVATLYTVAICDVTYMLYYNYVLLIMNA